jgi:hypothetical protein
MFSLTCSIITHILKIDERFKPLYTTLLKIIILIIFRHGQKIYKLVWSHFFWVHKYDIKKIKRFKDNWAMHCTSNASMYLRGKSLALPQRDLVVKPQWVRYKLDETIE